jgi:hypothetical protein
MASSKASTVKAYLGELPAERRAVIQAVRDVVLKNLDKGYEEGMQYGMIGWYVPHKLYPPGYHCDSKQPLPFAGLAAQKNACSLYLMGMYMSEPDVRWFREAWARTGKKLDMGKSCVRFKKLEDLPIDLIGQAFKRFPAKRYIALYEKILSARSSSAGR